MIPQDPQACSPFHTSILVVPPALDALTKIPLSPLPFLSPQCPNLPRATCLFPNRSVPTFSNPHVPSSAWIFSTVNLCAFLLPFLSSNCRSTPSLLRNTIFARGTSQHHRTLCNISLHVCSTPLLWVSSLAPSTSPIPLLAAPPCNGIPPSHARLGIMSVGPVLSSKDHAS